MIYLSTQSTSPRIYHIHTQKSKSNQIITKESIHYSLWQGIHSTFFGHNKYFGKPLVFYQEKKKEFGLYNNPVLGFYRQHSSCSSHLLDKTLTLNEPNLLCFLNLPLVERCQRKTNYNWAKGYQYKLKTSNIIPTKNSQSCIYYLRSDVQTHRCCENSAWVFRTQRQRLEVGLLRSLQRHLGPSPLALFLLTNYIKEEFTSNLHSFLIFFSPSVCPLLSLSSSNYYLILWLQQPFLEEALLTAPLLEQVSRPRHYWHPGPAPLVWKVLWRSLAPTL